MENDIKQNIDIQLSTKYRLTSDPRQYILHERVSEKSENLYYYTTLSGLVSAFIKRNVNTKYVTSLKGLDDNIKKYGKICEKIFNKGK